MIEPFTTFLTSLKQTSPVIFGGLAIASGIVLFGSGSFVESIGLLEFRESNLPYIGGSFVISVSILGAQVIFNVFQVAKKQLEEWQKRKRGEKKLAAMISELSKLTPDEKSYLTPFVLDQQASVNFLMEDGIKGSLIQKGILFQASNLGDMLSGWAYNLQPWAREHLEANQHLLDGASDAVRRRFPSRY